MLHNLHVHRAVVGPEVVDHTSHQCIQVSAVVGKLCSTLQYVCNVVNVGVRSV